jgi:hypothetical protein
MFKLFGPFQFIAVTNETMEQLSLEGWKVLNVVYVPADHRSDRIGGFVILAKKESAPVPKDADSATSSWRQ